MADFLRWAEFRDEARLDTEVLAARAGTRSAPPHRYLRSVTGYPPLQ
ncbi:MAG: hypothetical protein AAGB05_04020 [Pseudomonadota bacterium]